MIWVTSDFHFGHEKEFLWRPRGFESWEEAAEQTIKNYNEVVGWDDTVYILGDCMLKNDDFGLECLKRLKVNKFLAFGNRAVRYILFFKHAVLRQNHFVAVVGKLFDFIENKP